MEQVAPVRKKNRENRASPTSASVSMKKSAPVHKGKSLPSRASTRRQEPPSLSDHPVRPVPNAVNARCLKAKEATMSQYDWKTGVKHLRGRGFKNAAFCATFKASGINLLRATAFINRKDSGAPGPEHPHWGLDLPLSSKWRHDKTVSSPVLLDFGPIPCFARRHSPTSQSVSERGCLSFYECINSGSEK